MFRWLRDDVAHDFSHTWKLSILSLCLTVRCERCARIGSRNLKNNKILTITNNDRERGFPNPCLFHFHQFLLFLRREALWLYTTVFRISGDFPSLRLLGSRVIFHHSISQNFGWFSIILSFRTSEDFRWFRLLGFGVLFRRSAFPPFHRSIAIFCNHSGTLFYGVTEMITFWFLWLRFLMTHHVRRKETALARTGRAKTGRIGTIGDATGMAGTAEARRFTMNKFMPLPSLQTMIVTEPVNLSHLQVYYRHLVFSI